MIEHIFIQMNILLSISHNAREHLYMIKVLFKVSCNDIYFQWIAIIGIKWKVYKAAGELNLKRDQVLVRIKLDNDENDNNNILFDHNIQIEIIMYNSLENQIINWSGDYY